MLVCPKEERSVAGNAGENSSVWDSPSPKFIRGGSRRSSDHPTQKPVELMRRPLLNHTKRGELVYDTFLGSGTTLSAADVTDHVCYGIELDPKYCDVSVSAGRRSPERRRRSKGDGCPFLTISRRRG